MTTIVTRAGKGSPLTNTELDANFTNLKTTADAALPLSGGTLTGNLKLSDGTEFQLGDSSEFKIKHHASGYTHLQNTVGTLFVDSDSVTFRDDDGSPTNVLINQSGLNVSGSVSTGSGGASGKIAITGATATGEQAHTTFTNTQGAKTYAIGGGQSGVTNNGFVIRNVTDNTFPLVISDAGASTFSGTVTAPIIKSTSHYEGTSYRIYNGTLSNYGRLTADSFGSVIMHTGAGEGARLTPTGLGIGTSLPSVPLTVNNNTDHSAVAIFHAGGGTPNRGLKISTFSNTNSNAGVELDAQHTTGAFKFSTGGTERMRLSGGNVLVGKTSSSLGNAGVEIRPTNLMSTRINGDALSLNRRSSDGAIATFYRDGAVVGSLGTLLGGLYIADGGVGLRFDSGGTDDIFPCNATGGAADASINLGSSGARFKDLHLSGTANVGGIYNSGIYNQQGGDIQFWVPNVGEAVRIQQNTGNLLVGKSTANIGVVGQELRADGSNYFTSTNDTALGLNRLASDGTVLEIRRQNAIVGSIGVANGDLNINGDTGIRFQDTSIMPRRSGSDVDATVDIGLSSHRWKDLYLSGNATAQKLTLTKAPVGNYSIEVDGTNTGQPNFIVKQSTSERLRIDHLGNVRINNSRTTATKLHVVGGTTNGTMYDTAVFAGGANSTSGSGARIYISGCENDPIARGTIIEGKMIDNGNSHELNFYTSGNSQAPAKRLTIDPSGIATFSGRVNADNFQVDAGGIYTTAAGNDLNLVFPANRSLFIKEGSETHLTIDNIGRVGIGVAPSADLHLKSTTSGKPELRLEGNGADNGIITFLGGGHANPAVGLRYISSGDSVGHLGFYANSSSSSTLSRRMTLTSGGDFLVGTTNNLPANNNVQGIALSAGSFGGRLEASRSGGAPVCFNRTQDGSIIELKTGGITKGVIGSDATGPDGSEYSGATIYIGAGDAGLGFTDNGDFIYPYDVDSSTPRDGGITLGHASTRFKDLYLSNKVYAAYIGASSDTDTSINFDTANTIKMFTGGQEAARFDTSQNFLVGTTSPEVHAQSSATGGVITSGGAFRGAANGTVGLFNRINSVGDIVSFFQAGNYVGSISVSASATSYNTSSDQRLKENIADADDSGTKVDAIQVRKFDWKADGSHQDYGMIAQELQAVAPEAVSIPEDEDEMMGVDYSKLVPMLIKEIQSLRQRVASLEE